jgi:hypothetical protein
MHRYVACVVASLVAHAHALIPARHLARQRAILASMPDGLESWGCDDLCINQIYRGASLERRLLDGVEVPVLTG